MEGLAGRRRRPAPASTRLRCSWSSSTTLPVASEFAELLGFASKPSRTSPPRGSRAYPALDEGPGDVLAKPTLRRTVAHRGVPPGLREHPLRGRFEKKADGVRQSLQSYLPEYTARSHRAATPSSPRGSSRLTGRTTARLYEAPVNLSRRRRLLRAAQGASRLPLKLEEPRATLLSHFGCGAQSSPGGTAGAPPFLLTKLGTYQLDDDLTRTVDVPAASVTCREQGRGHPP